MGWLLAVLSGVLAGFSYPTVFAGWQAPELGFLAFFAWIPLFVAINRNSAKRAFLYSFIASIAHYSISMYWIYIAMNSFGNISPSLSVFTLLLLILFFSVLFGLIFLFSQKVCLKTGWPHLWVRPVFWVAMEYLRGHFPWGGHPWSQIGYSQGGFLAFIQSADLAGIYLTTFLLVVMNEVGYRIYLAYRERRWASMRFPLILGLALFSLNLAYGFFRLGEAAPKPVQEIRVGIVQGNIPQDEKWQRGAARRILDTFREGTLAVAAQGAELIVWPEASYPLDLHYDDPQLAIALTDGKADLLFGAVTRSREFRGLRSDHPYYNTALLADASGQVFDFYHKTHLVPFGEYVPYQELFFFAKKMTAQVGQLKRGEKIYPMKYRERLLGVLICYEDIFPEISRVMTAKGAQALINITNDAWYGNSSASYQHQVFAQFRAVETRRALVRAANTGLSSAIDRWGRILWQGGLFTREDFMTTLPLYDDRTVYVRIGDSFCYIALAAAGVLMAVAILSKKREG